MRDLKFALRQLLKSPGFTTVAVLTLALGIGVNTALFSVVNGVLLRPLPFHQQERLVTLWESSPTQGIEQEAVSPPNFAEWQTQTDIFERLAFWTGPTDFNLVTQDGTGAVRASYASANLFALLQVDPQLGRRFTTEDDQPKGAQTAIISHKLWQEQFGGDTQVLGRSLTVDTFGRRTYTIIGVMPGGFQFPEDTEVWLAAGWNGLPQDRREGHWLSTLGKLKPGVTLAKAQAQMNVIQARIAREHPGTRVGSAVSIVPLLRQTVGRNTRTALLVLWSVVAGVLLIACVNVANLMLARAASRQKEIGLRVALGAARWPIMRQLLIESVLLALVGGAVGTIVSFWIVKAFIAASPANIPRLADVTVDWAALCFTLAATVLTGLIFGLAPAWQYSRPDLNESLKESGHGAAGGVSIGRTRGALVVTEVALATVLLAGAGLMLQSLAKLLATDRGFRPEHVLIADLDFSVSGFSTWVQPTDTRPQIRIQELLERIRQLPGVQSAGAAYNFLRQDNRPPVNWPFTIFGRSNADGQRPTAEHDAISPGYLHALDIRVLSGRDFTDADTLRAPGVALVNESFVRRFFPKQQTLGQHISSVSQPGPLDAKDIYGVPVWYEIVGVVGDVKSLSAQPEPVPEIYRSYWQWPMQRPKLFVRATDNPAALAAAIRRETKAVIPNLPTPRIRLLSDYVGASVAQPRFQTGLLTLFSAVALLLAACGIYGVLSYSVAQRQREIGVRIALGAKRRDVLSLIIGQGVKLVLLGGLLGIGAALALTRTIRSLLYDVRPTDPITFGCVGLLLLAVALVACWVPARRAMNLDPMEALRHE